MNTESITLRNHSGQLYGFTTYNLGQAFKPLGSLYCITKRTGSLLSSSSHEVLYIGQTSDLSSRFADHHKEDAWKRKGATHISIHLDSSKDSRLRKETELVRYYNPCCNG